MSHINVRPAEERDITAIAAINTAAWENAFSDLLTDAELTTVHSDDWPDREMLADAITADDTVYLVAEEDEAVHGFAMATTADSRTSDYVDPAAGEAQLVAIYVDPAVQRQGIGQELVAAVEDRIGEAADRMFVETLAGNDAAITFYEKIGFVHHRDRVLAPDEITALKTPKDAVVLVKQV